MFKLTWPNAFKHKISYTAKSRAFNNIFIFYPLLNSSTLYLRIFTSDVMHALYIYAPCYTGTWCIINSQLY